MRLGTKSAAAGEGERHAYLARPVDIEQKFCTNPELSASCEVIRTSEKNIGIAMGGPNYSIGLVENQKPVAGEKHQQKKRNRRPTTG